MKYTQRETKEDKGSPPMADEAGFQCEFTRRKDTATAGVSSATTLFPEMASSAPNDDGVLALHIANFETAKQAVEKTNKKVNY